MNRYEQANTLVTSTDVTMSGTGTAVPEGAAGNADYSGWPWEVMLATVLGVGAPDRSEVTGQPWLMTQQNEQADAGSHLIWTAGWDTGPDGAGASSIHVYLSPGLYTSEGAWDTFLTAPATALAGVHAQDYTGLPLSPPTFQSASVAVTSVTNWLAATVDQFGALHSQAASGAAADFQGSMATEVAQLLGDLRASLSAMHEQMVSPEPYGASIGTAGDAATQFLANLMSAYLAWTQVPAYSPLGALVQVLENIATQDGNGASVIADPRNTPFGDLTSPDAWPAVEQQAKSLWTGLLTGESPGFAGLDPQARFALGKLTGQLAATSAAVVPVMGPGVPSRQPSQVNPGAGDGSTATPPPGQPPTLAAGAGAPGSPSANGQQVNPSAGPAGGPVLAAAGGPAGGPSGAPVPAGAPLALLATGPAAASAGAAAGLGGAAGPAGTGPDAARTDLAGPAGPAGAPGRVAELAAQPGAGPAAGPAGPDGAALAALGAMSMSGLAGALAPPSALTGAIGATAGDRADDAARPRPDSAGFTGTIGQLPEPERKDGGPAPDSGQHDAGRRKAGLPAGLRQAPTAGFSLGRDPNGAVLQQGAVPTVTARTTSVISSPVNSQLVPGAGALGGTAPVGTTAAAPPGAGALGGTAVTPATGGAGGTAAAAGPLSSTAASGPGGPAAPGGAMGDQVMLGRGAMGEGGPGGPAGADGSMMMPHGGMGGGSQAAQERMRRAYLPEEDESWGTTPGHMRQALGADQHDQHDQYDPHGPHGEDAEPEFVPMPSAVVGIGARQDQAHVAEEI